MKKFDEEFNEIIGTLMEVAIASKKGNAEEAVKELNEIINRYSEKYTIKKDVTSSDKKINKCSEEILAVFCEVISSYYSEPEINLKDRFAFVDGSYFASGFYLDEVKKNMLTSLPIQVQKDCIVFAALSNESLKEHFDSAYFIKGIEMGVEMTNEIEKGKK